MKIQLTPVKIIDDALVVWNEQTDDVDIVMDLQKLTFAPGTIEEMYAFHVLDHLFPHESAPALANWHLCLKKGAKLYTVVDDFEFISRSFVGGDISLKEFNERFTHPTQYSRESLAGLFLDQGFEPDSVRVWFDGVPDLFSKDAYELVISGTK